MEIFSLIIGFFLGLGLAGWILFFKFATAMAAPGIRIHRRPISDKTRDPEIVAGGADRPVFWAGWTSFWKS
jgi:hypothetical protein